MTSLQCLYLISLQSSSLWHVYMLVSNCILMSCQPHRVTYRQSNSVISKFTFQNSSHIYIYTNLFLKSIDKTNPHAKHKTKTYIHKHQTQIFEELTGFTKLTPFHKILNGFNSIIREMSTNFFFFSFFFFSFFIQMGWLLLYKTGS